VTTIRQAPAPTPLPGAGRVPAAAGWRAAVACGALALAAADLVAQLTEPAASPVLAVGAAFVDRTPGWLKDSAISWFGVHDKQALFAGMALLLAALCAGLGLLAARSRRGLLVGGAVLGAVPAVAAAGRPGAGPAWALPSVAGVLLGVLVLGLLTRRRGADPLPDVGSGSGGTADGGTGAGVDRAGAPSRRWLLHLTGTAAAAGALGLSGRAVAGRRGTAPADLKLPVPSSPAGAAAADLPVQGLTPWVTPARDFYRIDTALAVPRLDAGRWRLRVHGLVENELELTLADLLDGPLVERWLTLTCVSNEVGGRLAGNARWLGLPLERLLERARPRPGADMVLSRSTDGWTASTPLAAMTDGRDALLAVGMNGAPLPREHGFPARLVVPGLYGYVSATKWVVDLEVTRFDRATAYWTDRGYSAQAPVRTASRIDVPASFARVTAGPVTVAGVAWAQHRGIREVQVRVDGGPWQPARLSPAVGAPGAAPGAAEDTWRQWSWTWPAEPGQHTLQVAATDATGALQPQTRRAPRPDGATGWHTVAVQVS
jgi:DMSO/TMAO reductase YedYZ molybdopterin-dependent catalytic subunit